MILGQFLRAGPAILALVCLAVACAGPARPPGAPDSPPPAPTTPTPQPATDEDAIRQLVLLEGQGVVSQDIDGLMGLWANDAVIADAKHTPDDPADDARWQGSDAIRERYIVLVGAPAQAGAQDIAVTIAGETAMATSTSVIGSEVAPLGDQWRFQKRAGRWWISALTYNLEAAEP
jgi:hypothetical protein